MTDAWVPWLHAGATLFMVGVIWFVQVVHYPLMALVGADAFPRYARRHQVVTTTVVAPAMLLEVATAGWLLIDTPTGAETACTVGGLLLLVIWLSTACVQVPCHSRLTVGFDRSTWVKLVRTNWIRTLAWTTRGWIAIDLLRVAALPAS